MAVYPTQRNANRNQSTVDYVRENLFISKNRYVECTFTNNTGGDLDVKSGIMVIRDLSLAGGVHPVLAAGLAKTIGVLKVPGVNTLADAETISAHMCIRGDVDSGLLVFPLTVTLDTTVGDRNFNDVLNNIGIMTFDVTENLKADN